MTICAYPADYHTQPHGGAAPQSIMPAAKLTFMGPKCTLTTVHPAIPVDGFAWDPAESRPVLAEPNPMKDPEFLMLWINDLTRRILKALTCVTQESIVRSQEAQKASLKSECENIDKEKTKQIEANRQRKKAKVLGLLVKIASTLFIAAVVAAALISTSVTGPIGVLGAIAGAMALVCAVVDLTGACCAAAGDSRGFTLASKLNEAGVKDAELVACAMKMDLGGMTAIGLKDEELPVWAVTLVSMTVMVLQAVLMAGGAAKAQNLVSKLTKPAGEAARKACMALARKFARCSSAVFRASGDDIARAAADDAAGAVVKSSADDTALAASRSSFDGTSGALKSKIAGLTGALAEYAPEFQKVCMLFKNIAMSVSAVGSITAGAHTIDAADVQAEADRFSAEGMHLHSDQEKLHKDVELAMKFVMELIKQMHDCSEIVKDLLANISECMEAVTRSSHKVASIA